MSDPHDAPGATPAADAPAHGAPAHGAPAVDLVVGDTPAHHSDDHMSGHDDDHGEGHMHAESLGPVDLVAWGAGILGLLVGGITALAFAVATGYL